MDMNPMVGPKRRCGIVSSVSSRLGELHLQGGDGDKGNLSLAPSVVWAPWHPAVALLSLHST